MPNIQVCWSQYRQADTSQLLLNLWADLTVWVGGFRCVYAVVKFGFLNPLGEIPSNLTFAKKNNVGYKFRVCRKQISFILLQARHIF
jgi:hypothetical protein